jgi:hypothetical protein
MKWLRSLEHLDRGFESHSRYIHVCLPSFCVSVVLCMLVVWSPVQGVLPIIYKIKETEVEQLFMDAVCSTGATGITKFKSVCSKSDSPSRGGSPCVCSKSDSPSHGGSPCVWEYLSWDLWGTGTDPINKLCSRPGQSIYNLRWKKPISSCLVLPFC